MHKIFETMFNNAVFRLKDDGVLDKYSPLPPDDSNRFLQFFTPGSLSTKRGDTVKLSKPRLALFIAAWPIGLLLIYLSYQYQVDDSIASIVETRSDIIRQDVDLAISIVDNMSQQMATNIELVERSNCKHPSSAYIHNINNINIYGVDGSEKRRKGIPLPEASLTGMGKFPTNDMKTDQEIYAALYLSLSISKSITDNPNFVWSYYTSKRNFIYISPNVAVNDFHFSSDLYQKPFWIVATPKNDHDRKTVISDAYNDEYGQGLMFTVSSPVYYHDEFRGVCSLDLGLKQIRKELSIKLLEGTSLLVDEKGQLVASTNQFHLGDKLNEFNNVLSHMETHVKIHGNEYFARPVIGGELYVVHEISTEEKINKILKDMTLSGMTYTAILFILFLLFQLKAALDRTTKLAITDNLTGLYNRRAIEEHSVLFFEQSTRMSDSPIVLICMMDIDHFKKINDTYGHAVGDEAIKAVANVLRREFRKSDLLGRIGGDEFLVIFHANSIDNAKKLGDRMCKAMAKETICNGLINLTVSVGCVELRPEDNFETAVKRSDKALYEAKRQGRNRVVFEDSI